MQVRRYRKEDEEELWCLLRPIFRRGDTYVVNARITRKDALAFWLALKNKVFVGISDRLLVGSYILRSNYPGGGAHVANAAFAISVEQQRKGFGKLLAKHCLGEASRLGYRAMQFNFAVSTNKAAIQLWTHLGFKIVGRLPGAFRHPAFGFVDAFIMHRSLVPAQREG